MSGGRNIRDYPGTHAVELVEVEGGVTNGAKKREKFIPQLKIHMSTNEVLAAEIEKGRTPKVGDPIIMNDFPDYFYTDVRGVLGAVLDEDPADDEFDWQAAKDEAEGGTFDGTFLAAEVYDSGKVFTKGKKVGKPINDVCYSPAPKG